MFAVLKRDATDLVVQKATELGVSALLPAFTERTNAGRVNLDRLQAIAIEAAEQSERLTVPAVRPAKQLDEILADVARRTSTVDGTGTVARMFGAGCRCCQLVAVWIAACWAAVRWRLLIGPEGGFGPRDHALLGRYAFVRPVSLGPRILRAETAAIVGLALLQALAVWLVRSL